LLAILKAGGAYVPLDPQSPSARQVWAALDCSATLVLARERDHFLEAGIQAVALTLAGGGADSSSPGLKLSSERPAYVMYTSGSTGTPKGAVITHGGVVNLALRASYAGFNAQDRFGFASNPAFDSTTLEIWAPLLRGAAIVVIPENVFLNPHKLALLLQEQRVSVLILVAGVLRVYAQVFIEHFPRLRYLITGGDVADVQTLRTILAHNPPEHLVQTYGPTETTQFVTAVDITDIPEDARSIPIGRPIANARVYLLDGHGEPVPLGATGEIYIGGAGVARGYLNRAELTAERFVPSPFVEGDRLYRTDGPGSISC
ncbi:AMP-binding protein, partial [Sphingomonas sanguinis]|uniref:AMP-binding protein n=1 Tax=Sphingomonas sanguinis TaxID=33051 RepID=UPI000AB05668